MPQLTLSLLGGFAAQLDGRPMVSFRSQKARALLAYLVMETRRPHERATLATLFWPDTSDTLALRNLSQTLVWLRRAIGHGDPPFLLLNQRQIEWNVAAAVEVDALRFQTLLERQRTAVAAVRDALREAVALYAGEFLAGFGLSGCLAVDEWLLLQREYFQHLVLEALFQLTEEALTDGEHATAATLARRQLALDRWREESLRQLLRALAADGKYTEALADYENARRLLAEELGVEPQPETLQLADAIREARLESKTWNWERSETQALSSPHNLPLRLTSLLGRESELAQLSGWLSEPEARLVTISGIGGVGKTRLALAVASSFIAHPSLARPASLAPQAPAFSDGVWFVPLAGLRGGEGIQDTNLDGGETFVAAVAATLGLTFAGLESPYQQLERSLRNRHLLLVLDNYEQLVSTWSLLLNLLHSAPGVRALITSRQPLGIAGERLLVLEGLPLPPPEAATSKETLLAYSSACLFYTRALERGARLNLDDEAERQSLVRICRLAEGLPLVIELAAIWVGHFTCGEIAAEMATNLDFLSTESTARTDLPARQRSPRAAFDYAWQMLSAAEQQILAQLALLHAPFSREAAMTVTEARLVDLLSLVNKSLLRQTSPGWYAMHSLVRQFALERLHQMAATEAAARERHATYFLGLVAGCDLTWYGPAPQQARAEIRPVLENSRIAWQWAIQHQAWTQLNDALLSWIGYYRSEGLLAEALDVLSQLSAQLQPPPAAVSLEARLLSRALAYQSGLQVRRDMNAGTALALAQAAVDWAKWAGDPLTQSLAAYARGSILNLVATLSWLSPGDYDLGRESLEQAIDFGRQVLATDNDEQTRARVIEVLSLNGLGNFFLLRNEKAKARAYYDEALVICRSLGYVLGEGQTCTSIGELLENEGSLEQALQYRIQALQAYRQVDEPDSVSECLGYLCGVLTYLGDYQNALQHGNSALQLRQRHGLVSHFLTYRLSQAAFHLGDDRQVMQLLAAAAEEVASSPYTFQLRLVAGECATRLGRWEEAADALQVALALALQSNNSLAAATVQRAKADLALARGDTAAALTHVEALLPVLAGPPLASSYEPLRLYWTCYRALKANSDPRSADTLAAAYALLQSRVALIQDPALRQTFIQQVTANREIMREWTKIERDEKSYVQTI